MLVHGDLDRLGIATENGREGALVDGDPASVSHEPIPQEELLDLSGQYFVIDGDLTYRYVEFGHVADWRSLFLLKKPDEESRAG